MTAGALGIEPLIAEDYVRVKELMANADQRIGFVDASVLAIVRRLHEPKLATLCSQVEKRNATEDTLTHASGFSA